MKRSNLNIMIRLTGLAAPLLPIMLAAIIMGVLGFFCAIFITVFGGLALLDVLACNPPFTMSSIFVCILVFTALRGILRYAEQACNHYIAFKLLARIRDKVFSSLRQLAPAKLEGRDRGNLISIITTDIELLEVFYAHTISPIAIAVLVSTVMTALIGQYHAALALVACTGYITVGVVIPLIASKHNKKAGQEFREEFGDMNSFVLDSLRGLKEILQYGIGMQRLDEMGYRTDKLSEKEERIKNNTGLNSAVTGSAILLFSILTLFVSVLLYEKGIVNFDGILIPVIAMMSSFGPVVALANLGSGLTQTFAAGNRVLDILDEKPVTPDITVNKNVGFGGASFENVGFSYTDENILSDFHLKIPKSKIVGIAGKSGSGKSTMLRLLMRFWDVNSGKVTISDTDVKEINTGCLRDIEGFVTQETHLFHDSIENNVKISKPDAEREQVEEACKKASIHEFIMTLPGGYDTNIGELGETLSGGERQRIGLARAFLHDAPLLLLDEPTSNLDSLNEAIILKSLKEEQHGKTVVLVSHRASTMKIADQIYRTERREV